MNPALVVVYLVRRAETAWTLTAQRTGRSDLPLNEQGERQARALGPALTALRIDRIRSSPLQRAADRVIGGIRAERGSVLLFGHREVLRILAVRWIGLAPIEGRRLLLATTSLSVLGYDRDHDHDLSEPAIHAWNGRLTAVASTR